MEKNIFGKEYRLGILGGGQLGRMFIQEAINYNIDVHIMENDENAPSANLATTFTKGEITNYEDVLAFGKNLNVLTVEIENVNIEALYELERIGVKVFPQARVLEIIKDKGVQKEFYKNNQIPSSDFFYFSKDEEISLPCVQKIRTGGYDGQGVKIIRSKSDLKNLFSEPSIIEELIPFEKELSVIVARNESGQTAVYQTVECQFNEANLVEFLFSPAEIAPEIEKQATDLALDVINKLEMIGILAVELFLTADGKLYVNEVAPRPHNSGHQTIECNISSQFEQHLRAILDLPLGSTDIIQNGVMINLLGETDYSGNAIYQGLEDIISIPGVHVHLYGKLTTKPNRKMGHVTVTNSSMSEAKRVAKIVKSKLKIIA
ncbi:MAG: 5-(carboxyamino)imidazole ribonucleotide synthase [Flavobacteriales bacterium]|tara:strand:- start:220 stop:1347 length:1128 start_codon:yes stop_codon:yes gene_type:complete